MKEAVQTKTSLPADPSLLFEPLTLGSLALPNRIVMAPMTRNFSPSGIPGANVAAYYRRRAEGGIGLLFTEGTYIAHRSSGDSTHVPRLDSAATIDGWRQVTDAVHAAGGKIAAQLWHIGRAPATARYSDPSIRLMGPSGVNFAGEVDDEPMTQREIDAVIEAYGKSAAVAKKAGFDGVELHGAHGYLIDQFFWDRTNRRTDKWGGDLVARTRFGVECLREVRAQTGKDFLVSLRISQWKIGDYSAKLAQTPEELGRFLEPLVDSGLDVFHCSNRRFWDAEFDGSDMNLAGWVKKITGMPTITVGSLTLNTDVMDRSHPAAPEANLGRLLEMMGRGDFDLVAIGRAAIANPTWPAMIGKGRLDELASFSRTESSDTLY